MQQEQSRAEEEEKVKFAPLQSTTTEDIVQPTEDKVQKECLEELGYESVSDPNVSFPCKGRDTIPIEKHNEEDQKMRQEQIEVLLQAKEATSPFQWESIVPILKPILEKYIDFVLIQQK